MADFDSDGDLDIIGVFGEWPEINVQMFRNVEGSFVEHELWEAADIGADFVSIDLDGDMDILQGSERTKELVWYKNVNGTFDEPTVAITSDRSSLRYHGVGDFDNDGDPDLVSLDASNDKLAWFENEDGKGQFGPANTVATTADSIEGIAHVDLDGDGDLDLVSAEYYGERIAWYECLDDQRRFRDKKVIAWRGHDEGFRSVHSADFDHDGDADLVVSFTVYDRSPGIVVLEHIDGATEFVAQTAVQTGGAIQTLGDIDGDGDVDLLTSLGWHENEDGKGGFGPIQLLGSGRHSSLMDLDDDGDLDVVSTVFETSPERRAFIGWHENTDGLGTFGEANPLVESVDRFSRLTKIDVENDGDLDFVYVSPNLSPNTSALMLSHNDKSMFGAGVELATLPSYFFGAIWADDIDDDGDADQLIAHAEGPAKVGTKVAWLENIDGVFNTSHPVVIGASSLSIVSVVDVDSDSDSDLLLVFGDEEHTAVDWYEHRLVGDSNDDGIFNSADLVKIFQVGEYEDDIVGNSTFDDGDWIGDGEFTTADLVFAFQGRKLRHCRKTCEDQSHL